MNKCMANDGNQSKRIKLYSMFVVGLVSIFHVRDTRCNHWHVPGINSIITVALIHFQFENCYAMTFSFVFVGSPKYNKKQLYMAKMHLSTGFYYASESNMFTVSFHPLRARSLCCGISICNKYNWQHRANSEIVVVRLGSLSIYVTRLIFAKNDII